MQDILEFILLPLGFGFAVVGIWFGVMAYMGMRRDANHDVQSR